MDVPIATVYMWITQGTLIVQPDYQRYYVWKPLQASRLIESLLLNIPIPVVYIAVEADNTFSVVDGQQRLTSIHSFINGKMPNGDSFHLTGLQVMKELNAKRFQDLSQSLKNQILITTLRIIKIEKDTDQDVKYEVFERLNLGSVKLNDQELRNCVYRGSYNKMLGDLAENRHMMKVMHSNEKHDRMEDKHLILRFFAFYRNTHLNYKPPMKQFLNHEMEKHRDLPSAEIVKMSEVFVRSIEMAYCVFGENAFRRYYPGTDEKTDGYWEPNVLNKALWDTILYGLSKFEKRQIIPIADAVREEYLDLVCNDDIFVKCISSTTDKKESVKYRADKWLSRLTELVGYNGPVPRTFSRDLKKALFDKKEPCKICNQQLHDIDDTEVDHKVPYWRGGETLPSNAQLVHRYCNRFKGKKDITSLTDSQKQP